MPTPLPAGGPVVIPADPPLVPPAPARPHADTARVYEEKAVDMKPRRVAGLSAPYPEWGPKLPKGKSVSITASFVVTEEGLVTDIQVERGGGVLEAVLPEVSRWKYQPGTKDGVPVKVRVRWKHTFIGG
jgi:Gram-negative bacterial TonB protein C-terminal